LHGDLGARVNGVLAARAWGLFAQAEGDGQLFLGEDFLPWMVLAFGAALVIGPLFALVRPPAGEDSGERPPLGRTIGMIVVGAVAAVWGLASLIG
jgi:hypothetical protein